MERRSYGNLVIFLYFLCFIQFYTPSCAECKDKYKVFPDHSACLSKSPKARSGSVDKNTVISVHNKYRLNAAKQYKATDILKMVWDDELAMVAQKWAENCKIGHDQGYQRLIPGRFSVGQNIASGPSPLTWEAVVQMFYNESEHFTYGSNGNLLHEVGHFTQLTWASSYILGCGYAVCDGEHFYVCNYAPSGNGNGQLGNPFAVSGATSTDLIDCQGRMCDGGSELDSTTCKCVCRKDYYKDPFNFLKSADNNCQLTCLDDLKQNFYCGNPGYAENSCLHLSNMPFDCPSTCHVCPYADPNYQEGHENIIHLVKGENMATSLPNNSILYVCFIFLLIKFVSQ